MKKRKYIILWIVCAFVLVGLAISYPFFRNRILGGDEEKPYHYERRSVMRTIETGEEYWIMLDPETGCCYLFGRRGGVCQLTNYDGSPYLANGWRDIG
jgi:hypothetical protein